MKRQKVILIASGAVETKMTIEASASNGVANIRLVDRISDYGETSANAVRDMIDKFVAQGITEANLYINSKGGSVLEATEIANELSTRFQKINITVGAVAASAVTRILAQFPGAKAFPNSQFMIHRPKLGVFGDLPQINAQLKLLENTTADYKSAYAKAFNKSEDEIEALWANGDYWMNAQEAKKLGLIAEILPEKQIIKAEDVALLVACGAPDIPEIESNQNTEMDINQLRSALGLDADATEEQVLAAAKEAKEAADAASAAEAEASNNAKLKAESIVDKAIREKKIPVEKRENYISLATADYDNTKEALEAMTAVPQLSAELKGGKGKENRDDWDLDAWLEKDPEGLDTMAETDPEKFKKINNL